MDQGNLKTLEARSPRSMVDLTGTALKIKGRSRLSFHAFNLICESSSSNQLSSFNHGLQAKELDEKFPLHSISLSSRICVSMKERIALHKSEMRYGTDR